MRRCDPYEVLVCKGCGWRSGVPTLLVAVYPRVARSTYEGIGFRTFRPGRKPTR